MSAVKGSWQISAIRFHYFLHNITGSCESISCALWVTVPKVKYVTRYCIDDFAISELCWISKNNICWVPDCLFWFRISLFYSFCSFTKSFLHSLYCDQSTKLCYEVTWMIWMIRNAPWWMGTSWDKQNFLEGEKWPYKCQKRTHLFLNGHSRSHFWECTSLVFS